MLQGPSTSLVVVIIAVFEVLRLYRPQSFTRDSGDGGDSNHTDSDTYADYYYLEQPSINVQLLVWVLAGLSIAGLLLGLLSCFICCRAAKPKRQGLRIRLDGK